MGMSGSSEDVLRSSETDDSSSRLGDLELGLKESSKSLLSCSDVVDRSDILDSVRESTQPSSRLELPELPCGNDFHVTFISCFGGSCVPLLSSSKEPLSRAPSIIAISRRSIMAIEHELESGSSLSGVQVLVSSLLERSVLSLSFLSMERRLESAISRVSFAGSSSGIPASIQPRPMFSHPSYQHRSPVNLIRYPHLASALAYRAHRAYPRSCQESPTVYFPLLLVRRCPPPVLLLFLPHPPPDSYRRRNILQWIFVLAT
ncbi:hypothetical protein ALC57_03840 [Trachymyrmex cornetzi]|uniref:Uncharacterized protein n=1 Tax=Trachymyrmex cornetzi TaxID=471704 RepID=A0A195EFX8_9HYME|nr:hypothetical protein ALC57_03840 [Trachymyrmex cornetzi]